MGESNITIQLPETKISSEFIGILNTVFSSHGLKACTRATVTPVELSDSSFVEWSNISKMLPAIKGFLIQLYGGTMLPPRAGSPQFSLGIDFFIDFSTEMVCDKIFMHAMAGPKSCYSAEEKADALTVQDLTMQLHEKFSAIDSCAIGENEENPWFHFSKAEWKQLPDLPLAEPG